MLFAESGSKPAIRLGIFLKVESNHRIYPILLSGATGSRRNHKGFFVKIFISANGSTTDASVGQRFGLSPYFIIVNPQTMEFEAVPNSGADHKRAAGMQAVVLAVSKEVDMVLTGYCSPTAMKYLTDNGIEVISMGPIYAWYPLLKELRGKGTKNSLVAVFLGNRAVKPFLLPVMISYFGGMYVVLLTLFTIAGSLAVGYLVNILVKD